MVVPLVDLRAAFAPVREEVLRAFETVLDQMNLLLGPNVEAFEREFTAYCEAARGVAVSSGTDALYVALRALGIGPRDEVIVPAHTFFATVEAIIHTGATPVMVDVEPECLTIDVDEVRRALTPETRAILPVHLYGHPADLDPILEIARDRDLRVIEDAAQAHGARYKGRRCGSLGDAACFSFYFTKNLGALGEGGFVTSRDPEVAELMARLRHHGHASKYEHTLVGHNFRMDELQAAVLRIRLPRLDASLERRRAVARAYDRHFEGLPLRRLQAAPHCEPAWHVYAIRVQERDALREHLDTHGVGTGIHYREPAHLQPALRGHPHRTGGLEVTEGACRELLSLPIYPELTDEQVDYVAGQVRGFFAAGD
jgi:dTDP-4-amino-4,6-dideoxygalactose transaminase